MKIEPIALQAVARSVATYLLGGPVETDQAMRGAQPQAVIVVRKQAEDVAVRQTVGGGVMPDGGAPWVKAVEADPGTEPEEAVFVRVNFQDPVVAEPGGREGKMPWDATHHRVEAIDAAFLGTDP